MAKAKVVRLPYGTSIKGMNQFDFMEQVLQAKIDKFGKLLMSYYGIRYNFAENKACYASQRTIEKELHLARGTFTKWKKYLEDLEWIKVVHRKGSSDFVFVRIGKDDPSIKYKKFEKDEEVVPWDDAVRDSEILDH